MNYILFQFTMENWGFPWHILLALIMAQIGYIILMKIPLQWRLPIVFFGVNLIGFLNEWIQGFQSDMMMDMMGNNIGIIIAIVLSIILRKE